MCMFVRVWVVEVYVKDIRSICEGYQYAMGVHNSGLYHCSQSTDKGMGYIKVIIIVLHHADNMADSVLLHSRQVADGSPGVSLFCRLLHQDNTRTVH